MEVKFVDKQTNCCYWQIITVKNSETFEPFFDFLQMLCLFLCCGAERASTVFQLFRYLTSSSPPPCVLFVALSILHFSLTFLSSACPFVLPHLYPPTIYLTSFPSHPLLSGCHGEAVDLQVCVCLYLWGYAG